jgi:hypothetical protein
MFGAERRAGAYALVVGREEVGAEFSDLGFQYENLGESIVP